MKLSERLVKLRELRGMTQNTLAKKANISTRAIQYYENGERQPKGENLLKLANALNIPKSVLLSDEAFFVFSENNDSSEIRNIVLHNKVRNNEKNKKALAIGGSAALWGSVPLMLLNPIAYSVAAGGALGLGLIGGILGISNSSNKAQLHSSIKLIYKELSRIEAHVVILNDKIDSFREKYERLADITQQNDAEIDEYKQFIEISRLLSVYQEYRSLLKQKGKYCSLLVREVESNSGKNNEIVNEILEEINNIEIKEREYTEKIMNIQNEKNESKFISEDKNE
ncbi:helix-turn-helix domain-containing protein [Ruminococcus sp. XPD3002]|uniref:helix-turn-helix domain-containing protein n=1 Tax=Ruminococcus sp. XPD3002 TaxID=1452269 RepID=UPI000913C3BC|nr:Helix-turn-helix [Ruminococcus flavefaciens]